MYDIIRRDWGEKFMTIDMRPKGAQKSLAEAGNKTLETKRNQLLHQRTKWGRLYRLHLQPDSAKKSVNT